MERDAEEYFHFQYKYLVISKITTYLSINVKVWDRNISSLCCHQNQILKLTPYGC